MAIFKPGDYVKCNRTGVEGFLKKNDSSSTYPLSLDTGIEGSTNTYTNCGRYTSQDDYPCLVHISPTHSDTFEIIKLISDKQLIYFKELGIYVYDSPNGVIQLTKEQTL